MMLDHACSPALNAAPVRLFSFGRDYVLAIWDLPADDPASRLTATLEGESQPRPSTRLLVPTLHGNWRSIAAVSWAGAAWSGLSLFFRDQQGRVLARACPAEQRIEPFEAPLLMTGLDAAARIRVIMLLVESAQNSRALRDDPVIAGYCREAALQLTPTPRGLTPRVSLAPALVLCETDIASDFGPITALLLIGRNWVRRMTERPHISETPHKDRAACHLALDAARAEPGTLVLLVSPTGLSCRRIETATGRLPSLLEWLEHAGGIGTHLREYAARALIERPRGAAILGEMQLLAPLPARLLAPGRAIGAEIETAIGHGVPGLFLAGWIADPHLMIDRIDAIDPLGGVHSITAPLHRFPRKDQAQGSVVFAPGLASAVPRYQTRLEVQLHSGVRIDLVPPPQPVSPGAARDRILTSVPPRYVTETLMREVIAPAIAPLQSLHMATRRPAEIIHFGPRPLNPSVSIIVPLYRTLEFLRFQLGAFATDTSMRGVELIYVLDSPEQRVELEHLLWGLTALYGLSLTLVVNSANFGYAAANNAGAAIARGQFLLLLNSDVIPEQPGWLKPMTTVLQAAPEIGAVGPKLLFDDGSLQHAGLYFGRSVEGRWINQHYFKGYARDFPAALQPRLVPGVTGACCLIRRARYEAIGGFTEDYIIGDYEDSDLCLKLRQAGSLIFYQPQAVLYHLERQSIKHHEGYTMSLACEYNSWLHSQRWSNFMTEIMADPHQPGARVTTALGKIGSMEVAA